jgi:hypothetical protein
MSSFEHYEVEVGKEESVHVVLEEKAKIYLLDDRNWERLCTRQRFRYVGRSQPRSSVVLRPDRPGHYHVVIAKTQTDEEDAEADGLSATVTLV